MADAVYARLRDGTVATAVLVRDLRRRWGASHDMASVHGFVREVAACLLRYDDVEVGDLVAEEFVAWNLEHREAHERIDSELIPMDDFLDDDTRYVFRRKTA